MRCQTFLEIDDRERPMQKYFGHREDGLLVLGHAMISHGGDRSEQLFSRFVANLGDHGSLAESSPAATRARIAAAATSAMSADSKLMADNNGSMTFVVVAEGGEAWRVCLLGAYYVLHFRAGRAREVLPPQSAVRQVLAKGMSRELARDLAGIPVLAAAPDLEIVHDVLIADVRLASGETLLALPEPRGLFEEDEPVVAPQTWAEIRDVAARLRRVGARNDDDEEKWSRSLLAVHCPPA